jgi:deoxycytidine triphosphate deaminase
MLSNFSIAKELNKNIFISPLTLKNIKGATVNLTASEYAWSLKTKQKIVNDNIITIPARDTALIATKEILHVTSKIAGTYHSKVKLVSKGLSHIGTTLDPTWFGHSLIAIHNVSDKDIDLKCEETFVSLTFHYLDKPSKKFTLDNHSGRTDILNELGMANIPVEIGEEGIGDLEEFKKKCYKDQKNEIIQYLESYKKIFFKKREFWFALISILVIAGNILFVTKQEDLSNLIIPLSVGIVTFFLGKLIK